MTGVNRSIIKSLSTNESLVRMPDPHFSTEVSDLKREALLMKTFLRDMDSLRDDVDYLRTTMATIENNSCIMANDLKTLKCDIEKFGEELKSIHQSLKSCGNLIRHDLSFSKVIGFTLLEMNSAVRVVVVTVVGVSVAVIAALCAFNTFVTVVSTEEVPPWLLCLCLGMTGNPCVLWMAMVSLLVQHKTTSPSY
jgi:hypothetical protein